MLLDNVPHDWLLPHCCAVVHHGGAGTTAAGQSSSSAAFKLLSLFEPAGHAATNHPSSHHCDDHMIIATLYAVVCIVLNASMPVPDTIKAAA